MTTTMIPFKKTITILDAERKKYTLKIEVSAQKFYKGNESREGPMRFTMSDDNGQGCHRIVPATDAQSTIKMTRELLHLKEINQTQYDTIVKTVEELEQEQKERIILTENDYERLSEAGYTDRQIALAIMLDLSEQELEEDVDADEAKETEVTIQGRDYYFGTDYEMNQVWLESVEDAMDDYLPEVIKKHGYTSVELDKNGNIEVSMSMTLQSREEELARYDGYEHYVTLNGETYYLYRTS